MSVSVMATVWKLQLPDSEKIVLLALADCANDEGHCWPGMTSLCRKTSKSDRTVQQAIQALVGRGHLTRREIIGKGCNYTVHPRSDFTPERTSPPKGTTLTPEAASGKPSRTIRTSRAKALSVARAWDSAISDIGGDHAFRVLCVQWAVENLKWAAQDAGIEFDRFSASAQAHDRRYKDWTAAWRSWCRSPYCKVTSVNDLRALLSEPLRG
jgi:hypothetical protein